MIKEKEFRKIPIIVKVIQYDGTIKMASEISLAYASNVFPEFKGEKDDEFTENMLIKTLEGLMKVNPFDWIITGIKGERYACKPDIFEKIYEEII